MHFAELDIDRQLHFIFFPRFPWTILSFIKTKLEIYHNHNKGRSNDSFSNVLAIYFLSQWQSSREFHLPFNQITHLKFIISNLPTTNITSKSNRNKDELSLRLYTQTHAKTQFLSLLLCCCCCCSRMQWFTKYSRTKLILCMKLVHHNFLFNSMLRSYTVLFASVCTTAKCVTQNKQWTQHCRHATLFDQFYLWFGANVNYIYR